MKIVTVSLHFFSQPNLKLIYYTTSYCPQNYIPFFFYNFFKNKNHLFTETAVCDERHSNKGPLYFESRSVSCLRNKPSVQKLIIHQTPECMYILIAWAERTAYYKLKRQTRNKGAFSFTVIIFFPKLQLYKLCVYLYIYFFFLSLTFQSFREGWFHIYPLMGKQHPVCSPSISAWHVKKNFTSPSAAKRADTQMQRGKLLNPLCTPRLLMKAEFEISASSQSLQNEQSHFPEFKNKWESADETPHYQHHHHHHPHLT